MPTAEITPAFGMEAPIVAIAFVAILIFVGYYSYKKRVGATIYDFFLASRLLGYFVLGLSLYAAQYSGNSFIGYAARGYRSGFVFLMYPAFMVTILPVLLIVASRLIPISINRKLTLPTDYIRVRFGYGGSKSVIEAILALSLVFLVWGTFVQFFEQAIAMGYLGEVISAGMFPYMYMVVVFVVGVIIFTILGGFRGAALANAVMGLVMLLGLVGTLAMVSKDFGSISDAVMVLAKSKPSLISTPSTTTGVINWFSTIALVGVGAPLYIHILQHVMASKDPSTFKRTFLFTPYFYILTATSLLFIGIIGASAIPGLGTMESERIVPLLVVNAAAKDPYSKVWGLLWLMAVLSATLSTAATTIIAISVTVVREVYRAVRPAATERETLLVSRIILALIALLAIPIVIEPRATIWRWTEIKFEGLIQVFPAIVLSLYIPWVNSKGVLSGMIAGAITALALTLSGTATVQGIHAGVIGLILNTVICLIVSRVTVKPDEIAYAKTLLTS
ncbi:MAG: sodium:solute symporter family protein [Sulfolobales archaeon]